MPRRKVADPLTARIGARVRELRSSQKLTQEKLAWEVGLSKGHVSGIEKGLVRPRLGTLAKIAKRLDVELFDLLVSPTDSPRQHLVDITRSMKLGTIRRLVREADTKA